MAGKIKNKIGERYGLLTVIKRADDYIHKNGVHESCWLCACDCGKNKVVKTSELRKNSSKGTRSCGCLAIRYKNERRNRINTYDLSGEYGIGYTSKGEEFYFDLEDYDKIKDYYWFISTSTGYIRADNKTGTKKDVLMHRLIYGLYNNNEKLCVDHINHKRNDNRKCNIRIVTQKENTMNKGISINNKSGVAGVSWKKNKWESTIGVNGEKKYLGRFQHLEDAIQARLDAEDKYYGEYSYKNSMKIAKER